jgi:hypothetical protein
MVPRDALSIASRRRGMGVLSLLCVSAWAAMPLFCALTGKGIQLYHFPHEAHVTMSYAIVAGVVIAVESAVRRVATLLGASPAASGSPLRHTAPVALLALTLAFSARWLAEASHTVNLDDPRFTKRLTYKQDLAELTRELERPEYEGHRLLATLDYSVYVWWAAFRGDHAFLEDPFTSTRSDLEMEARFMTLARSLGVSQSAFEKLATSPEVQVFWLSHNKYSVSRNRAFSSLKEYPPNIQEVVRTGDWTLSWLVVVPKDESERLARAYSERTFERWRFRPADIVILTPTDRALGFAPPKQKFRRTFVNASFEVWVRARAPASRDRAARSARPALTASIDRTPG